MDRSQGIILRSRSDWFGLVEVFKLNTPISIVGFGDQARVLYEILQLNNQVSLICCFVNMDQNSAFHKKQWRGIPVLSSLAEFLCSEWCRNSRFIVALGNPIRRSELFTELISKGHEPISIIHPNAIISSDATIGNGCMLSALSYVGVNAEIGSDVILNTHASVDHDCVIGSHVNISPGATLCGRVIVGDYSFIGAGAVIADEIQVGKRSIVAAGAVVVNDVMDGLTVMGVPAMAKK